MYVGIKVKAVNKKKKSVKNTSNEEKLGAVCVRAWKWDWANVDWFWESERKRVKVKENTD